MKRVEEVKREIVNETVERIYCDECKNKCDGVYYVVSYDYECSLDGNSWGSGGHSSLDLCCEDCLAKVLKGMHSDWQMSFSDVKIERRWR